MALASDEDIVTRFSQKYLWFNFIVDTILSTLAIEPISPEVPEEMIFIMDGFQDVVF